MFKWIVVSLLMLANYAQANKQTSWVVYQQLKTKPTHGFNFQDNAISPLCVSKLKTRSSDILPVITSVDLNGCQQSLNNQTPTYTNNKNGYLYYYKQNDKKAGYFEYELIGRSNNGLFVIRTRDNHGGKIQYDSIQVIKLSKDHLYYYINPEPENNHLQKQQLKIRNRQNMTLVSEIVGAQACQFAIHSASVNANTLTVAYTLDSELLKTLSKKYKSKVSSDKLKNHHQCAGLAYYNYNLQTFAEPTLAVLIN